MHQHASTAQATEDIDPATVSQKAVLLKVASASLSSKPQLALLHLSPIF